MASSLSGVLDIEGKTLWQLVSERALLTPDKQMARDEGGVTGIDATTKVVIPQVASMAVA